MKQTNDLSMMVAEMFTEVITGVITGVTSARRRYYRNLLRVAIVVMCVTFALAVLYRDHLPGLSSPPAQGYIYAPSPTPARSLRPEPTPPASDDAKDPFRLTRTNPL